MERMLTELLEILREEIARHGELHAELTVESARDGELSGAELMGVQSRKMQTVYAIRNLETRRVGLIGILAEEWDQPEQELTLRRIISLAPAALGQALGRCHAELLKLVTQIREMAQVTSANAQSRLKAIDATLAVIREAMQIHPTYSEEGRLQQKTPNLKSTSA